MIETTHLLPPVLGPRSNPVLFGIAEAIAELLPIVTLAPRLAEERPSSGVQAVRPPVREASETTV